MKPIVRHIIRTLIYFLPDIIRAIQSGLHRGQPEWIRFQEFRETKGGMNMIFKVRKFERGRRVMVPENILMTCLHQGFDIVLDHRLGQMTLTPEQIQELIDTCSWRTYWDRERKLSYRMTDIEFKPEKQNTGEQQNLFPEGERRIPNWQ
jgi:hypothetical protein